MKHLISFIGVTLISAVLFSYKASCQDSATTDNDIDSCNTEEFTNLTVSTIVDVSTLKTADYPVGVMVRTPSKEKIRGIKVYIKNKASFYLEVYSGKPSESGFMNMKRTMKQFLSEPLLCKPSGNGYYTIDLSAYSIMSQGDLYFVFSPGKGNTGEAQQLAVYKSRPKTRFSAISLQTTLTYFNNPIVDCMPIFITVF